MYTIKNKIQLIGFLGNDPVVKRTDSGDKLVKFSIATNETYRNSEGVKIKNTQWHNLIAWNKIADIAEKYLQRGTEVAIEGKLLHRDYIDKEGNKRVVSEIQVSEMLLLSRNPAQTSEVVQ